MQYCEDIPKWYSIFKMMFTPITAILAVIAIVSEPIAAGPAALRTVGALKWIGEVVPGNGNITLVGNDIHVSEDPEMSCLHLYV